MTGLLAATLVGLTSIDSSYVEVILPLTCLVCGMLISVTSILNYGLGVGMAILGGVPALMAVYFPSGQGRAFRRRLPILTALGSCVLVTLQAYAKLRPALLRLPALAPFVLYLGLVPIWLQLALVA